jgi:hypothetical protein
MYFYVLRSQTADLQVDTTGFHPPAEKSLEVTFHVLVPKNVWNWDNTCKSHMHMQFGHPKLGEWKEDVGEFIIKRYIHLTCIIIMLYTDILMIIII